MNNYLFEVTYMDGSTKDVSNSNYSSSAAMAQILRSEENEVRKIVLLEMGSIKKMAGDDNMAYTWEGMTKISRQEAVNRYKSGLEVYLLYSDNTEGEADSLRAIEAHLEEFGYENGAPSDWKDTYVNENATDLLRQYMNVISETVKIVMAKAKQRGEIAEDADSLALISAVTKLVVDGLGLSVEGEELYNELEHFVREDN